MFFYYDPEGDGMVTFDTAEERDAAVKKAIADYLIFDEGWGEMVEDIVVGEITGKSTMCDVVRPKGEINEDGEDEDYVYWGTHIDAGIEPEHMVMCNYRIEAIRKD